MLEVHGILVDHPLCDVEQPSSLDPIQRLCFIWAQIKRNLTRGHWDKDKQYKWTPFHLYNIHFDISRKHFFQSLCWKLYIFTQIRSHFFWHLVPPPPLLYFQTNNIFSPGKPWPTRFVTFLPWPSSLSSPSITMDRNILIQPLCHSVTP